MTSLLTNESAMVALNTLRSINKNLAETQSQISTGKKIANSRDNAAIWAVSTVMQSDVDSFKSISESLDLGASTVAVARTASEQITTLLTEIKSLVVSAQEDNVDRSKIQTDIGQLRDQISSIVGAAQFNGLNLLQGFDSVDILSSLDRAGDQSVNASKIGVDRFDLTTTAGTFNGSGTDISVGSATYTDVGGDSGIDNGAREETLTVGGTIVAGEIFEVTIGDNSVSYIAQTGDGVADVQAALVARIASAGIEGITAVTGGGAGEVDIQNSSEFTSYAVSATVNNATTGTLATADGTLEQRADTVDLLARNVTAGDGYRVTIANVNFDYIAKNGDTINEVARGLKAAIDEKAPGITGLENVTARVVLSSDVSSQDAQLLIDNDSASTLAITREVRTDGESTGGLRALASIDVSTADGAERALDNIESLIQVAIDASANFGSSQKRIEVQSEFVINLTDSLKAGIGALTDANMEEASARLQSLQVQQQLGVQALSIANQQPQSILGLFQ